MTRLLNGSLLSPETEVDAAAGAASGGALPGTPGFFSRAGVTASCRRTSAASCHQQKANAQSWQQYLLPPAHASFMPDLTNYR